MAEERMEIQKLNHRHDAIVEWLVMNPHRTQGECAKELNYTEPWLSQLIATDMFKAKYQELCLERGMPQIHSLGAKMSRAAHMALDKVIDDLENQRLDGAAALETSASMLDRLGYSAKGSQQGPTQIQNVFLTADDLVAARERSRNKDAPIEISAE